MPITYQRCGSYDTRYLLVLVGRKNTKTIIIISVLLFAKQIMRVKTIRINKRN